VRDANFGELWVDGQEPYKYDHVFASVQTINNQLDSLSLSSDYFDFIIIDIINLIFICISTISQKYKRT